jgi:hypothetical protein
MATFEDGLYGLLSTNSTLVAMQGNRIFAVQPDEKTPLPFTVYGDAGSSSTPGLTSAGPQRVRIEFAFFGNTPKSARNLRDATRKVLDGLAGVMLPGGFLLSSCLFHQNLRAQFDNDARQYRFPAEFYFTFNLQ